MKKFLVLLLLTLVAAMSHAASPTKPIVSVLGDSYSTFEGYVPEGNRVWYSPKVVNDRTDVTDVRQTWWWQLITEGGYILGVNESYSGATVSYTGYHGNDYSDRSFITRLPRIGATDILLIFGGTNDAWTDGPIGEYRYEKLTRGHFYEFRPAMGYLLTQAVNRFPGTRIICIINDGLKAEVTESIVEICHHTGIEYIRLTDIDKRSNHPTVKGMTQIKDQVLDYLRHHPTPK